MPIYDLYCKYCGYEKEDVILKVDEHNGDCPMCDFPLDRVANTSHFKLTYNPQTDMVDWDGNRSRYWDDWKKLSDKEKKKMRIPKHDGE